MGCFIVWIRDFIKKFCKTIVFFTKTNEIFEIKNFYKIPSFTISFLLFFHFWHFFSISPIQTCPKIMEFFVVFYWKGYRFYQLFLENSKSSFKKILICEIIFFPKFCSLLFGFLFFYYFWHFIFNFVYLYLATIIEIFMFFYFKD